MNCPKIFETHTRANKPQIVKIQRRYEQELHNNKCPCSILCEYLMKRGVEDFGDNTPFIFRDGTPVKAQQFRKVLKAGINSLNLDENIYDMHSLRIGQTHDLFKWGVPIEKNQGNGKMEVECS